MTTQPEVLFDLWYLLVEVVFGSVWLSGIAVAVVLILIGILGRMSFPSISIIVLSFFLSFYTGYYGVIVILPFFLFALTYFVAAVISAFNRMQQNR